MFSALLLVANLSKFGDLRERLYDVAIGNPQDQLYFENSQGLSSNGLFVKKYRQPITDNKQPETPRLVVRGMS